MPDEITEVGYKNALEMLDKVASSELARGLELDLGKGDLENGALNSVLDYQKVAGEISEVEGGKKQQPIRKQDIQIFQKDTSVASPSASFSAQSVVPIANKGASAQGTIGKGGSELAKRAAKDIGMFADAIEKDFVVAERKIMKLSERKGNIKTVMGKLSVQDQISDLEKISMGLDQKAFDEAQMKLIREEVSALQNATKGQDAEKFEEPQRGMIMLRNQRLQDVINKLSVNS